MGGAQWMVVLIVAIVMIAKIVKMGMQHEERKLKSTPGPDDARLRDEVRVLKERLAVLERIATDGNTSLERQIEALREDRPAPRRLDDEYRRDGAGTRQGEER